MTRVFGLLGHPLSHSFSPKYFELKWENEGIANCEYRLLDFPNLDDLKTKLSSIKGLDGFNVTIPYKEAIMTFCDELSHEAEEIGAVNCVVIKENRWIGHNTDASGFAKSIKPFLDYRHENALILGSGGAAKAVKFVLNQLGLKTATVSRNTNNGDLSYSQLNTAIIQHFQCIVNCTPLGMHPNTNAKPSIPYEGITSNHFLIDLIYNPEETIFLKEGKDRNAMTLNGKDMLIHQAEAGWNLWNS
ncbi:shikimate dehydrogenase family protein [Luteibaculum oceani]|uniref:Shikimate dehydrogenase n=1 Tax=Luteibaculum oceani TaxID=1294296 RepID=A0A5C6V1B0_9FLAO|nr:shikimate dehydrogenase [Luteibaculum oceani]TXC77088.1 shikimate dehydrogenase [Luteibaculum oceani]